MRLVDADALKAKVEIGAEIAKLKFDEDMAVVAEAVKECISEVLDSAPTIEAEPVRRGKWIEKWFGYGYKVRCSKCGCLADQMTDYCSNCGARMEDADD